MRNTCPYAGENISGVEWALKKETGETTGDPLLELEEVVEDLTGVKERIREKDSGIELVVGKDIMSWDGGTDSFDWGEEVGNSLIIGAE